jgi:hypothetical protein
MYFLQTAEEEKTIAENTWNKDGGGKYSVL